MSAAIRILAGVVIGFLLVLSVSLYIVQDSLLFHEKKLDPQRAQWIREHVPDSEVSLATSDDVRLHGWYVTADARKPSPLIIYFGGNAEEVSHWLDEVGRLRGFAVLLMNYRGYGLSEGEPSEVNLFRDALLVYDEFSRRSDVDKTRIVAMGRSLGTGVAVYLASQRPLRGVILISPYESIRSMAQEQYPYVPVSLLLKHHFDSLSRAPSITVPLLALAGSDDRIIPPVRSQRLLDHWGGVGTLEVMTGADHVSITEMEQFWTHVSRFLHASLGD